jgi:hypothetical protein
MITYVFFLQSVYILAKIKKDSRNLKVASFCEKKALKENVHIKFMWNITVILGSIAYVKLKR